MVRQTRETARNTFEIASEKTRADRARKPFLQVRCFFMGSIIPGLEGAVKHYLAME